MSQLRFLFRGKHMKRLNLEKARHKLSLDATSTYVICMMSPIS